MFARRLVARVRPSQIVGRVVLVSVLAGPSCSHRLPARSRLFQRPARSTTSLTRNAIPAHSSHSIPQKRPSSSSAVAGAQQVYSSISTPRTTTPSVSARFRSRLSHSSSRSSSALKTFSSSPLSFPPSQSAHSARAPSYSVCALFDPPISLISPAATRFITRHKARQVAVIEAEATNVDVRLFFSLLPIPPQTLSSPSTRQSPLQVLPLSL